MRDAPAKATFGVKGVPEKAQAERIDADASIDLSDAISILFYLYASGAAPSCLRSADVDGDGTLSLTDAIRLLTWLFVDRKPPSAPFPSCGRDTGLDPIDSVSFPPCQ